LAVAASSELVVGIAAQMARDGAISLWEIVQYALVDLTLVQALHHALVRLIPHPAPHLLVVVVAASGVVTVAIVAMMVQVGVTTRAPTVQHALGTLTVALRCQHADKLVESDKSSSGSPSTCFLFWEVFLSVIWAPVV